MASHESTIAIAQAGTGRVQNSSRYKSGKHHYFNISSLGRKRVDEPLRGPRVAMDL